MHTTIKDLILAYSGAFVMQITTDYKLEILKLVLGASIPLLIKEGIIYFKNKRKQKKGG